MHDTASRQMRRGQPRISLRRYDQVRGYFSRMPTVCHPYAWTRQPSTTDASWRFHRFTFTTFRRKAPMWQLGKIVTVALFGAIVQLSTQQSWAAGTIMPTVTLTTGPNPSQFQQPVVLIVTVAGSAGAPAGQVLFMSGDNVPIPGCGGGKTPVGDTYTCVTVPRLIGTHSYRASYLGDATYLPADSQTVSHRVLGKYNAQVTLHVHPAVSARGEPFTLTAEVLRAQGTPAEAPELDRNAIVHRACGPGHSRMHKPAHNRSNGGMRRHTTDICRHRYAHGRIPW